MLYIFLIVNKMKKTKPTMNRFSSQVLSMLPKPDTGYSSVS